TSAPPPTAAASVRIQYHSRSLASTMAKTPLQAAIATVELRCVTARKNAISAGEPRACSQSETRRSSAASELRAVRFHAIARKSPPASANAVQPAMASARGERLRGCGSRRSIPPPAVVLAPEDVLRGAHEFRAAHRIRLDLDAPARHPEHVEGVRLRARAVRGRRPRLDQERGLLEDAMRRVQ